uniref:Uncharacterized protein n=1 Tax=Ditylenchus dipsaci TaxID=166011 RepID=A0A915EM34_9BILA
MTKGAKKQEVCWSFIIREDDELKQNPKITGLQAHQRNINLSILQLSSPLYQELYSSSFVQRKITLLEFSQYLEAYLWKISMAALSQIHTSYL